MVRLLALAMLGLGLLTGAVGHPEGARAQPKLDLESKANLALVVKLQVPRDTEWAKVHEMLTKLKARGATKSMVEVSKAGEGASAEVQAESKTPSKDVAAVVEVLLDSGITKISVQVKK